MRLWHPELLHYLPNKQLISQWRELNSIYKKQNKHILINFIYKYDKEELFCYSNLLLKEIFNRGIKIKDITKYKKYFNTEYYTLDILKSLTKKYLEVSSKVLFKEDINEIYLVICCWNLFEKYIRGQKGFSNECINKITYIIESNQYTQKQLLEYIERLKNLNLL